MKGRSFLPCNLDLPESNIISLAVALLFGVTGLMAAQQSEIVIDIRTSLGHASPYLYGQFIEYMGQCIEGGIYDPGSTLADENGIRRDVLEKAKELAPTMIRFPGGTFVKTFHWMDGVGPRDQRRPSKNLIWGGINSFGFGTCEFIDYCRAIGCEPVLVVNLSTGTPDEAANWVEYCNGTENTYYANLRRSHGYEEPFRVKYWALGPEEAAEPDAGRHQDPHRYVEDVWHFIKLMKLTDPTIQLIADGERGIPEWNKTVMKGLDGAVDYISFHGYVSTDSGRPFSIFHKIDQVERELGEFHALMQSCSQDSVTNWKKWYRFPPRQKPLKMAVDEWGIWEYQQPPYGTTVTYEWRHALATAYYLNALLRCSAFVEMANWAQMVNILAPIRADSLASVRQTVFYPLREYRRHTLPEVVGVQTVSPEADKGLQALNAVATIDRQAGKLVLFVVNVLPRAVKARIRIDEGKSVTVHQMTTLTAERLDAVNTLGQPDREVVSVKSEKPGRSLGDITIAPEAIQIIHASLPKQTISTP